MLEAYYGVLEAGTVLFPLNARLAPHELAYILNDAGAITLFLDNAFVPLAEGPASGVPQSSTNFTPSPFAV
jgi:acyl-CoA synthetase (AMP-forming)/AMP-acid ligase II